MTTDIQRAFRTALVAAAIAAAGWFGASAALQIWRPPLAPPVIVHVSPRQAARTAMVAYVHSVAATYRQLPASGVKDTQGLQKYLVDADAKNRKTLQDDFAKILAERWGDNPQLSAEKLAIGTEIAAGLEGVK